MLPTGEVEALKALFPNIALAEEGGTSFILIKNVTLPDGCEPRQVEALLCPSERDGYPSRLFLSHKVSHHGKGTNWSPSGGAMILGRVWWAVSWRTRSGQSLTEMVLDHLAAFRG